MRKIIRTFKIIRDLFELGFVFCLFVGSLVLTVLLLDDINIASSIIMLAVGYLVVYLWREFK